MPIQAKGVERNALLEEWESQSLSEIISTRVKKWWQSELPDPWPEEIDKAVRAEDAVPVCHRCMTPLESPVWFCPDCGTAVGPYNNIMPYIYIFSIGEVLRSAVGPEARYTPLRIAGYAVYGLAQYSFFAPIYFLRIYLNYRKRRVE